MKAYFSKDEFGGYEIPIMRQRPVILMGPPGIGKTAIMEQIAQELGVGLVSYSMTHHTRQSALGLPFIETKSYGGREYSVSEYTMSEIIASVYDLMEDTGLKEGILFLDEINCVSETLAPSMLQFLQYKVFGRHRIPDGWILVTAGNPPEYNSSVREFDMVTWDRLKRIDIEPDYEVWKEYAFNTGVHASILTYLDSRRSDFYKVETTADGKSFVTARGWTDLSDMIRLYEKNGLKVSEKLICQYLQDRKTAEDFAVYYDLFNKYRADYKTDRILEGDCPDDVVQRAKSAKFNERLAILGLLLEGIAKELRSVYLSEMTQSALLEALKDIRDGLCSLDEKTADRKELLELQQKAGTASDDDRYVLNSLILALESEMKLVEEQKPTNSTAEFGILKADYDRRRGELKQKAEAAGRKLSNMFRFCEDVFGDGQEMLILVTELSINRYASRFINRYGCSEYFAHNKELLFYERSKEIIEELDDIGL